MKKAARDSGNCHRAKTSAKDTEIIADWERGTFWAGLLIGVSFALMGIIGGWLGW